MKNAKSPGNILERIETSELRRPEKSMKNTPINESERIAKRIATETLNHGLPWISPNATPANPARIPRAP